MSSLYPTINEENHTNGFKRYNLAFAYRDNPLPDSSHPCNRDYCALSDSIRYETEHLKTKHGVQAWEQIAVLIANLAIDSALELCGITFYNGAMMRFVSAVNRACDDSEFILDLADSWLAWFARSPQDLQSNKFYSCRSFLNSLEVK